MNERLGCNRICLFGYGEIQKVATSVGSVAGMQSIKLVDACQKAVFTPRGNTSLPTAALASGPVEEKGAVIGHGIGTHPLPDDCSQIKLKKKWVFISSRSYHTYVHTSLKQGYQPKK